MATVKTLIGNIRGKQGERGERGDNGTSIVSVEQTTISSDDGGTNVITTTLSDGKQTTFNIKNGSKGEKGDSVIVDSELSSTSTNPVQNKVVNAALGGKLSTSGDSKSNTVTFTSNDVADGSATSWTSVTALASGISHATFFQRVSQMFKNVRYLYKMLGTTDISSVGDGTVKGAISTLNSNLSNKINNYTLLFQGGANANGTYSWQVGDLSKYSGFMVLFHNGYQVGTMWITKDNIYRLTSFATPEYYATCNIQIKDSGFTISDMNIVGYTDMAVIMIYGS